MTGTTLKLARNVMTLVAGQALFCLVFPVGKMNGPGRSVVQDDQRWLLCRASGGPRPGAVTQIPLLSLLPRPRFGFSDLSRLSSGMFLEGFFPGAPVGNGLAEDFEVEAIPGWAQFVVAARTELFSTIHVLDVEWRLRSESSVARSVTGFTANALFFLDSARRIAFGSIASDMAFEASTIEVRAGDAEASTDGLGFAREQGLVGLRMV
jgi:hypothetical protein